jgi:rubrerythrin
MWKSNKVADLIGKRQKIDKEIEKIQKSCNHHSQSLKLIRERVDSSLTVIRWVCDKCFLSVGYPSDKERKDFIKD